MPSVSKLNEVKQIQDDFYVDSVQDDTGDRQKDERLTTTIRKRMGIYKKKKVVIPTTNLFN